MHLTACAIELDWKWTAAESASGVLYDYPGKLTRFFQRTYSGPGIYRWAVLETNALTAVYIGEAENVCRRLGDYLRPGSKQPTTIRIKQSLDERRAGGATIQFQLLEFSSFSINTVVASRETLTSPYIRRMVESLAIESCLLEKHALLNRGTNLVDKTLDKIQKRIPNPGARERFMRSAKELRSPSPDMRTDGEPK